jgi:hypothetical protein
LQKTQLNNMNSAAQKGTLGTRLDALEFGSATVPAAGTLAGLRAMKYSTTPAIGTATYVHAAIALTDATQSVSTAITNPDFPRVVTIKGNASGITGNVVITGRDINDGALTDTIALNGATEVLGVKAFKTVLSIDLPVEVHAGTDTVSIGVGNKIGFPIAIPNASTVIAKTFDGAVDSSTITVAATAGASLAAVAGTFNGTKIYELVFLA